MNVFIRAMVRIFSFGERWNVLFNSAIASLNKTLHLSPHENILTIALINIHYLHNIINYCIGILIGTNEDPSLRIESFPIINLRAVFSQNYTHNSKVLFSIQILCASHF